MEWTKGALGTEYFRSSITDERACTLVAIENEKVVGYLTGWIYKKQNPCRLFKKTVEVENMLVEQLQDEDSVFLFLDPVSKYGMTKVED